MLPDDGGAGAVQPVAHVFGRGELVMEDVDDDRASLAVVVEVHGVFLAAYVLFKNEARIGHHAFIIVLLPVAGMKAYVFQRLLPVLFVEDGIHAHAEEAHGRLENEGRLQRLEINVLKIGGGHFAEHEVRVYFREHAAEGGLVLAEGNALLKPLVGGMPEHPGKGIFAGGVNAVASGKKLVGLLIGNEAEGAFGRGGKRRLVAEHGHAALGKIFPEFPGHILFVKNDHAILTRENGSARHALG